MMKNEVKSRKFCETDDYITMEYFLKREGSRTNDSHIPIIRRLITIGRSPNCTITLKSIRVSRLQCEIIYSDENIFLRDTQSSNGTYVNNEKLTNEMRKLEVGDYIGFGVNPLPKRTYDSNQFVFSLQKYQSVQSVEIADDDNVDGKSSNEIMDHTYNLDPVDNLTLKNTNSDDFLIQYDFKFSDDEVKQTSINHQKEIDLKYDKPNRESILTLFNDSDDANDCMASRSTQSTADVQIENKGLLVNRCETVDSKLCDAKKETAKKDVQDVKVLFFRQDSKNIGSKSRRIGDNSSAVRKRSKNSSKPSSKKFVDSLKMSKEPSTLIELLKRPLQPGKGQLEPTKYFDVEVIRIDDSNENTLDWSEVNNPNTMNISSNFSHMTSNFGNLTSNFGTLTSNLGSLTSNFSQSASNFSHTAPKIDNKATHYGNLTSKVDNITSKVDNITSKSSTSTNPEYQPSTSEALRKHLMSKTSTPGPLLNSKIIQKPSNVQVIRRLSIDCRNQMTHTDPASNARTMTSKVPITPPKLELIRRYSTEKSKIINKVPNLGTESTVINKILPRFPTTSGTKSETITSGLYAQKYQTVDLTSAPNDTYGTFETDSGNRKFSLDYYNNVTDNEDDCKFIGQIVMDNPGPMRSFGGQAGSTQQVMNNSKSNTKESSSSEQFNEILVLESTNSHILAPNTHPEPVKPIEELNKHLKAEQPTEESNKEPKNQHESVKSPVKEQSNLFNAEQSAEHPNKPEVTKSNNFNDDTTRTSKAIQSIMNIAGKIKSNEHRKTQADKREPGGSEPKLSSVSNRVEPSQIANLSNNPNLNTISRINGESSSANVHFKTSNGETSIEGIRVHLQPKYPSQLQSNLVESTSYEKDSQAEQIIHNNSIVRHQISNIPQNQASIHPTPRPIYRVDPQSLPSLNPQIKQQMLQNPPKPSTSNVIGQSEQPMKPKQSKSNNKPSRVRRTDAEINRDLELVNKKLASEMNDKRSDTGSKVLQNTSKSSTSSKHPNTTQKPSTIADQQPIIDTTEPCSTRKTKLSSTDVDEIKEIMLKAVEEIKEKIIKKEVAQVIVEKISDVLKSVVSDDEDSEILDEKLGVFVKKSKKGGKSAGTLDDVNKESVGNEPGSQLNNKNLPSVEVHDQFSTTRLNVQSVIPSMTIQTISPSMSSQNVLNVQPTATHMTPGPVNPLISATTAPVPILFSAANIPQNNPYNTSFTTIYTAPVPYHVVNSTPMLMNNTSMSTTVGNPSVNAVNQYGSAQVDVNGNHGPITYLPGIPGNSDRRSGSVGGNLVNYGRNSVNYGRNSTNFCQNSANSSQNLANFPQNSASFSQSLANLPQFDGISSQSPSNFHQNSASFPRNSANLPQNSASYPQNSTIFTQTLINLAQKSASFAQKPPNYANIPASLGHIQPNFNPNHDARVGFGHTSSIRPVTSQSSPKSDIRSQNSPILSDPVHYAQQFRHHHPNYPSVPTSSSEFYSSNLNQVHKVPPTSTHTEPTQEPPEVVTILNLEPAKQSVSLSNLLETSNNILMNNDADSNNLYATTMDEIFFPQNFDDVSTQLTSTCLQNNLLIDDLKVVEDCQVETEGQVKDSAAVADETNLNEETSQNDEGTDTTTDNVEITDTISNLKTESITVSQSNQIDDNSTCKIPINTQNDDNVDCDTSDEQKEEVQNSNTEINNKITTQIDNNDENVQNETHVSSTEVEEDIQACDDTAIVINNTKAIEEEVGVINQDLDSTNDEQTKAPPNDIPVNALDSSMAATSTTNNENLQHNNNQTSAPESVAETDLDQLEVSSFGSYNDQEDPLHEDDFKIPQTTRTTSRSKAVKSNVNSRSSQLSALNSTVRRSTRTRIVSKKVIEGLAALKGLKNKIDEIKDVMSKSEAVDEKEMDVPNSCEQYVESKIQEVTETYSKIAEKSKEIKAEVQCKKGRSQRNVWHKDEAVDIKDGKDDGVNRNAQSQTASKGDCRTESRERSNERQIVDKSCIQTPKDTDSSTKLLKPQDEAEITQKLEDSKSKPSESIRRSLRSRSHVENSVNITSNDSSSIDKATPILEAALKKDDKVPDAEDNEKSSTISPDQNDDKQATLKTIKTPTIEKVERQLRSSSSTKKLSQNSLVSKDKEPIDSSSEASEDHNMLDLLLLDSLNMLSSELLENRRKSENQDGLSKNIQDLMTSDINISKSSEDLTSHIKAGQSHARTERIRTRSNMSEDKDNQIVKLNKEDLEAISPRRSERDSSKTKNQEKSTQNTHNPIEPTKPKEITQNTDNTHQTNFHIRPKTRSSERLTPQISKNPTTLQKTKSFELIAADNSKESRKLRNSESSETDNNVNSSTITQNTPNATQTPLNVNRPTTRQSQKASDSLSLTQSTTTIEKTSEINKIKTDETVVEMPLNDTVPATSDEGSRRVLRNRSKSVDTRRVDKPTISGIFTKFDDSSSREASFSIDNLQKFNTNTSNEGTPAKNTEHEATPSVYKSNTNNRSSHLDESVRYLRNRLVPVDSAMPVESNKKSEPPSSLSHESANNDSQKSKNSRSKSAEPSSQHADNVENSVEIKEEAKSVRSLRSRVVPQIEAANSSIRDKSTDSKDTKAVVNESKSDKSAHLETSNPPESIQVEDVKTTRSGVTWCTQPLAQLSPPSAKSSKPSFSSVFSPISSIQFSQKPENIQSSQPFEDLNVRGLRRHTKIHQSLNKSSTESGDAHQATLDAKDNKSLDSKDNGSSEVRAKSSPDDKCSPNSTDKDSPEAKKQRLQNAITNKLLTINLTSLRSRSRNSDSHVSSEATKSQESQELPLKEPSNNNSLIRRSLHPPAIVSHEILKKILIKPRPNPNVDINKPTQPIKSIREQLLESQRRSRSAEKSKQVDDKVLSENEASKDKQDVKSSENGGNQDSLTISRHSLRSVKVKNAELTHKSTEATESEHRNRTISTTSTESAASLMGKSQPIDNSSINLSRHYTRSTRKIVLSESQSEPKEPSSSHAESAPSKSDKSIQELDQSNTLETQESRSSAKSDHLEPSSQPESLQSEVTKLTRSSSKSPSKPTPQRKPIASESEKIDSDIQQDQSTSITSSTNSEESTQKSEIHEEVKKCVVRLKKLTSEEIYKLTERSSSPSMSTRSTRSSMSSPERPLSRKSSISSDYVIDKRHLELMSSSSRRSSSDSNSDVVPLISLIHRPNLRSSSSDNTKKSSPNVKNTRMSTSVRTLLRQISDERASSTESLPNLVRKNIFNASKLCESSDDEWTLKKYVENLKEKSTPMAREAQRPTRSKLSRAKTASDTEGSQKVVESARRSERHKTNARESIDHSQNKAANAQHLEDTATKVQQQLNEPHEKLAQHSWSELQNQSTNLPESSEIEITTTHSDIEPQSDTILTRDNASKNQDDILLKSEGITSQVQREEEPHVESCQPIDESTKHDESMEDHNLTEDPPESTEFERDENSFTDQKSTLNDETPTQESIPVVTSLNQTELSVNLDTKDSIEEEIVKLDKDESVSNSMSITEETIDDSNDASFPKTSDCTKTDPKNLKEHEIIPTTPMSLDKSEDLTTIVNEILETDDIGSSEPIASDHDALTNSQTLKEPELSPSANLSTNLQEKEDHIQIPDDKVVVITSIDPIKIDSEDIVDNLQENSQLVTLSLSSESTKEATDSGQFSLDSATSQSSLEQLEDVEAADPVVDDKIPSNSSSPDSTTDGKMPPNLSSSESVAVGQMSTNSSPSDAAADNKAPALGSILPKSSKDSQKITSDSHKSSSKTTDSKSSKHQNSHDRRKSRSALHSSSSSHESRHKSRRSSQYSEKSSSEKRKLSTDERKSSKNQQKSSNEHKKSSVEQPKPSVDKQKSSADHKKPSIDHKKPKIDERKPSTESQKSSSEHHKSSSDSQRSSSSKRRHSLHERRQSTNDLEKSRASSRKSSTDYRKRSLPSILDISSLNQKATPITESKYRTEAKKMKLDGDRYISDGMNLLHRPGQVLPKKIPSLIELDIMDSIWTHKPTIGQSKTLLDVVQATVDSGFAKGDLGGNMSQLISRQESEQMVTNNENLENKIAYELELSRTEDSMLFLTDDPNPQDDSTKSSNSQISPIELMSKASELMSMSQQLLDKCEKVSNFAAIEHDNQDIQLDFQLFKSPNQNKSLYSKLENKMSRFEVISFAHDVSQLDKDKFEVNPEIFSKKAQDSIIDFDILSKNKSLLMDIDVDSIKRSLSLISEKVESPNIRPQRTSLRLERKNSQYRCENTQLDEDHQTPKSTNDDNLERQKSLSEPLELNTTSTTSTVTFKPSKSVYSLAVESIPTSSDLLNSSEAPKSDENDDLTSKSLKIDSIASKSPKIDDITSKSSKSDKSTSKLPENEDITSKLPENEDQTSKSLKDDDITSNSPNKDDTIPDILASSTSSSKLSTKEHDVPQNYNKTDPKTPVMPQVYNNFNNKCTVTADKLTQKWIEADDSVRMEEEITEIDVNKVNEIIMDEREVEEAINEIVLNIATAEELSERMEVRNEVELDSIYDKLVGIDDKFPKIIDIPTVETSTNPEQASMDPKSTKLPQSPSKDLDIDHLDSTSNQELIIDESSPDIDEIIHEMSQNDQKSSISNQSNNVPDIQSEESAANVHNMDTVSLLEEEIDVEGGKPTEVEEVAEQIRVDTEKPEEQQVTVDKQSNAATEKLLEQKMTVVEPITDQKLLEQQVARADQVSVESEISQTQKVTETSLEQQLGVANQTCIEIEEHLEDKKPEDEQIGVEVENPGEEQVKGIEQTSDEAQQPLQPHQAKSDEASKPVEQTNISIIPAYCSQLSEDFYDSDSLVIDIDEIDDDKSHDPNDSRLREFPVPVQAVKSELKESDEKSVDNVNNVSHCTDAHKLDDIAQDIATDPLSLVNISTDAAANRSDLDITHSNTAIDPNKSQTTLSTSTYDSSSALHPRPLPWNLQIHYKFPTCPRESAKLPSEVENLKTPSEPTKSDSNSSHKFKKVTENWTSTPTGPSSIRITKASFPNVKEDKKLMKSRRSSTLPSDAPGVFKRIDKFNEIQRSSSQQEPVTPSRYSITSRRSSTSHDSGTSKEILVISKDTSLKDPDYSVKPPKYHKNKAMEVAKKLATPFKSKPVDYFPKKPQNKLKTGIQSKVIASYTTLVRSLTKTTSDELNINDKSVIKEFSARTNEIIKSATSDVRTVRTEPVMTRLRSVSLDSRQVTPTEKKLGQIQSREADWYRDSDFNRVPDNIETQKKSSKPKAARKLLDMPLLDLPGPSPHTEIVEQYIQQPSIQVPVPQIQPSMQLPVPQIQPKNTVEIINNSSGNIISTVDAYRKEIQSITEESPAVGFKKKFIFNDGSEMVVDDAGNGGKNSNQDIIIEILNNISDQEVVDVPKKSSRRKITQKRPKRIESPKQTTDIVQKSLMIPENLDPNNFKMPQSIQISSNIDLIPQHNVNLTSDHPNLNSHDYPAINQYNPITHAVTANVDKPKTLQQIQLESKSSSKLIAKERLLQKLKNKLQKMRQIRESQERSNKPSVVQLNVPLTQEQLNLLPSMNVPSTSQHLNVQQHLQDSSDDGEYDNLPELLEITDCLNEDELEFIMNNRIRNAPQNSLNCDEMINKLERLLIKISGMEQNLHTLDSNDYVQQGQEDIISINDPLPSNFGFSNLEEVLKTVTMNAEQNKQMVTNPEIRNNEEQTKNSHRRHKRQRQDDKNQVRIFRVRDGGNSADNPQNSEHIIVVPFPNQANNPQFVPMPVQDINENQSSIQQPEKPHYIVNDQNQNNPQVADSNRSHRAYTFIEHEDEVLIIENNPPRMLSSDGNYMNRGENPNSSRNPSIHSFEHHNPEVQQPSSNLQQMMVNPQHFSQDSQIQVQRDSVIAVPYQNIEKNDPLSQQQRQHRRSTQKQTHQKRHMAKIGQMARNAAQSSERVILESQMFRQYVSQELSRVSKEHQDLGQHNLVSNQQLQEMQQMQQIIASSQQNLASSQQNMSSRQHHKTSRQQHPSQISSQPIPNLNLPNLDSIYQNLYLSHQQQASSQQQQALISQNPKSHFRNVASSQQNLPSYQLALNQQNLTSIPNHVPSSSQNITPSLQNLAANQLNVASIQEHLTQRQQHLISSQQHLISSQRHHKRNQKSQIVQRTITSDQLLEIMTQEHQKADHMLQMYMKHQSMSSQEPQSCSTHENQTNSQNLMNIEKPTSNSGVTVLSCERINPEIDYFNHQNVVVPNSQQISANTQTINPSNSQVNQYYQPNHPEVSPAHQNPTNSSKSVQHTLQPPDSMSYSESLRVIAQNIQNNKSMLDLASLIDRQVDVIVLDDSLEEDKAKEAEDEVPNDQQSLLLEQEEVAKMLRSISAEQQLTMTPPLVTNEDVVPPLIPLQAVMPMQMEPKEDSYVELSKSHDEDGKDDKYHQYVASQDEIQRPVPQLAVIPDNHRQIDQGFMLNAFEPVKYVPIVDVDLSGVLNDMTVPTQPSPEKKKRGRPAKPKEIKIPKKRGRKPGSNVRKIPTFAHKPLQKVYSSLSAMMADRQRMKYDKYKDGSQHTQPSLMLRPAIAENVKKEAEVVIHSDLTELGTADDNSNIDPIAVTKSDPSEDIDDRLEAPEDIDDSLEVCSLAETEKLSDSDEEDDEIEYKIDVEDNTAEFKESVPNDQTEPIDQPKMNNLFEITEPKIEFESKEDQEVSKTNVDRDNNKDMLRVPITIHKSNSKDQSSFSTEELPNLSVEDRANISLEDSSKPSIEDQNLSTEDVVVNSVEDRSHEDLINLSAADKPFIPSEHPTIHPSPTIEQYQSLDQDNLSDSEDITPFYPEFPEACVVLKRLTDTEIALAMSSIKRLESSSIYQNYANICSDILDSKGICEANKPKKRSASIDEEDFIPKRSNFAVKSAFSSSAVKTMSNLESHKRANESSSDDSDSSTSPTVKRHRLGPEYYYDDPDYKPAETSKNKAEAQNTHQIVRPSDLDKFCHRDSDDDDDDDDDDNFGIEAYGTRISTVSRMSQKHYKNYLSTIRTNEAAECSSQICIEVSDEETDVDAYSDDERILKMPIVNVTNLIPKEKSILSKKRKKDENRKISFNNSVFVRTSL